MSSNFLSHLQAKDERELRAKTTKAIVGPAVGFGADFAAVTVFKSIGVGKAVGSAASGLACAGIDGVKSALDHSCEESASSLRDELGRRYDSTLMFKTAVLFITKSNHYFEIDNGAVYKPFAADKETVKVSNFRLDGLPPKEYSLQPTGLDIRDALPDGPVGSHVLYIKIVRHYAGSTRCVWVKKISVELPSEGSLIFRQIAGTESTQTDVSNYAQITLFLRGENEIEDRGMVRLHTKYGFKIIKDGEIVATISTKTETEEILEKRTKKTVEEVERKRDLLFWPRVNPSPVIVHPEAAKPDDLEEISREKKKKLSDCIANVRYALKLIERPLEVLQEKTCEFINAFGACNRECNKPMLTGFTNFFYYEIVDKWHSYMMDKTCNLEINRKIKYLKLLLSEVNGPWIKIEKSLLANLQVAINHLQFQVESLSGRIDAIDINEIEDLYKKQENVLSDVYSIKRVLTVLCEFSKSKTTADKPSLKLEFENIVEVRTLKVSLK